MIEFIRAGSIREAVEFVQVSDDSPAESEEYRHACDGDWRKEGLISPCPARARVCDAPCQRAGTAECERWKQDELPQLCESDAELLNELETTLALLAFDAMGPSVGQQDKADETALYGGAQGESQEQSDAPAQHVAQGAGVGAGISDGAGEGVARGCAPPRDLQHLLDTSQRHKTAAHLNAAILVSPCALLHSVNDIFPKRMRAPV